MPSPLPTSLSERLAHEQAVFGAWLFLREPLAAEMAAKAGYDYICVDMQHGLMDFNTMSTMLAHMDQAGTVPIVRTTTLDSGLMGRIIDAGALGVIVPMVNSVEQAEAAVRACRYAPTGERSVGPMGALARYGGRYMQVADGAVDVIPMIETVEAVEHVHTIAAVPGISALYVGPADLSLSMGLPSGMDQTDPGFDDALRSVVVACQENGIIPGIQATPDLVPKRRQQGFTMITVGYDYQSMIGAFRADLATSKSHLTD